MAVPPPDLVSTLAFDPLDGLAELTERLAALSAEAEQRGFGFDRHAVRNELQAATFRLRGAARVTLLLSPAGAIAILVEPVAERTPPSL